MRDRQRRRERDGQKTVVMILCTLYSPLYTPLYNPLPRCIEDKRWKFQRMNFYANLLSKSSNINFRATQMLLETVLAEQSVQSSVVSDLSQLTHRHLHHLENVEQRDLFLMTSFCQHSQDCLIGKSIVCKSKSEKRRQSDIFYISNPIQYKIKFE